MSRSRKFALWAVLFTLASLGAWRIMAGAQTNQNIRTKLTKAFNSGNYKVAYEGMRKLVLDPKADPLLVGRDLELAVSALNQLGRDDEADELREEAVKVHAKNWRLLQTAAQLCQASNPNGKIIAGKFQRSSMFHMGDSVNSLRRDRIRALQLMEQAVALAQNDKDKIAVADLHMQFAHLLLHGAGYADAWRLQYLTDIAKMPDYDDGQFWWNERNHNGAPVDEQGHPILHKIPKGYEAAISDGERWRWMLAKAVELDPSKANEIDMYFAGFMKTQLGVRTLAYYGYAFGSDKNGDDKTGTYALHTLKDDETIARLATGLKRLKVPDEYNWIKIYERIAKRAKTTWGETALMYIAQDYEDRRQYRRAAEVWRRIIKDYGPGAEDSHQKRLDQIIGNWGRFEDVQVQPAGSEAKLDFRFRNGKKVAFEAHAINVPRLVDDIKTYLESNPGNKLDQSKTHVGSIGYRLVENHETKYLLGKVAEWSVDLKPRPDHVDDRVTIKTPLKKAGAYLVVGKMADGNVSRVIVWVQDTVIVKKEMENQVLYFVTDAVTGEPIADAKLELFAWWIVHPDPQHAKAIVVTDKVTQTTNKDGLVIVPALNGRARHWIVTATKEDRFATFGLANDWNQQPNPKEFEHSRSFVLTDRPIYRPEHTVHFKLWIQQAKYDQPNKSVFAGRSIQTRIVDPDGEELYKKLHTTDEYGGLSGEVKLPKGAKLGVYGIEVIEKRDGPDHYWEGGTFRVEEYKKPEFEVIVNAPKDPVKLGDKVTATIEAKYFFGAPVTNAVVKYKVLRSPHQDSWYPTGRWDWLYGRGYWWFGHDYVWYPGFAGWGCFSPFWFLHWGYEQPELVIEQQAAIGADGKLEVVIDTATAKELHGNQDHAYTITAEVTDQSRRTIVGQGSVLVARQPFQVRVWLDKGHYRAGDTIEATISARTLEHQPISLPFQGGRAKRLEPAAKRNSSPLPPACNDAAQRVTAWPGGEGRESFCSAPTSVEILNPVQGNAELTLYQITYDDKNEPVEKAIETWKIATNADGEASQKIKATKPGQYRLSCKVTDAKGHIIEGGYVFVVRGDGFDGANFRFNDLELTPDKKEYQPGDKIKLAINVNKTNGVVLLFPRAENGYVTMPKVIRLKGKSIEEEMAVAIKDMPNFFVEALTVADARVHTQTREIIVPPEKRIVNVEVLPAQKEYKPGEKATVKFKVTDMQGKPFVGQTAVSVYDKSVEYISDGTNVPDIKDFFWGWRRHHDTRVQSSLGGTEGNLLHSEETWMGDLGIFGYSVIEELATHGKLNARFGPQEVQEEIQMLLAPMNMDMGFGGMMGFPRINGGAFPLMAKGGMMMGGLGMAGMGGMGMVGAGPPPDPNANIAGPKPLAPTIRKNFADTAHWNPTLKTNKDGVAEIQMTMPDQLAAWKIKIWAMGHGATVGEGSAEIITKRDLLLRLQAPRFFVEKDEVVLSANVHNYHKAEKNVRVTLELGGGTLVSKDPLARDIKLASKGEERVDWRVKVTAEGEAIVRMKAIAEDDADAVEMRFPAFVHGMLKTESFTGVIRPDKERGVWTFNVPAERRVKESVLEVRYSPTLAGAMIDALPYLMDYPYGCTEQTLNRFLPTVIAHRVLQDMKLDLSQIEKNVTNLNSQEIGDDRKRVKDWQRLTWRKAVFNTDEVKKMTRDGINRLAMMQNADGGWGWWSGRGEYSSPHTTALVVHGLQLAKQNGADVPDDMLANGVNWLKSYQEDQTQRLKNWPTKKTPAKEHATEIDAMIYMTLVDAGVDEPQMRDFLYRDRTRIAVYAKAMFGLALFKMEQKEKLDMILKNIEQYLVTDDENQTAYLRLPADNPWWYWHGSEIEANAYYLKLLALTGAKDDKAARLVKYLLNNRRHASYWTSTRDTAICVEAFADYLKASGELQPDMTLEVWLDGKKRKEVRINKSNLFSFDNKLVLVGDNVTSGKHTLEIKRKGTGPVYFNAYVTNFTLEDFITKAGLEVKVNRKYYKLTREDEKIKVSGSRGQPLDQAVERYVRTELANLSTLKSGDLVEIELEIDSKNDYEYLIFEDPKAAGLEPMTLQSGYVPNTLGAYMELRDEKVAFFVQWLPRGKHSIRYRMRAEIPGTFSALPTRAWAMYAPELRGNSDEIKIRVTDR